MDVAEVAWNLLTLEHHRKRVTTIVGLVDLANLERVVDKVVVQDLP
jgi:hypothetical protein